jgi:hypothetical protein
VIEDLGLISTSMRLVDLPERSSSPQRAYEIEIRIGSIQPFRIMATGLSIDDCDVLLGMDIISQGDLAISGGDNPMFSFRSPSEGTIDFST